MVRTDGAAGGGGSVNVLPRGSPTHPSTVKRMEAATSRIFVLFMWAVPDGGGLLQWTHPTTQSWQTSIVLRGNTRWFEDAREVLFVSGYDPSKRHVVSAASQSAVNAG